MDRINLLVFSSEYDKALAALILVNTAREIDMQATMFFTFWGLLLIRRPEYISFEEKTTYEQVLARMIPQDIEQLPLSHLNFLGIGREMLQSMMKEKQKPRLVDFLNGARKKGVKFYACKLSMEVMGLKQDELLPEVEIVEAKTYLQDARESSIQLFI